MLICYENACQGTFLMIEWLRLHLPMQRVWVQSLFGEVRSHMPWGQKKNPKQHCKKFNKDLKNGPLKKKKEERMANICSTARPQQVLTGWCKMLPKGGMGTRPVSIFSSDHHFPDPIPNATPTSDPQQATTLRGTRVNRGPKRLSYLPRPKTQERQATSHPLHASPLLLGASHEASQEKQVKKDTIQSLSVY